jgi:hypothetical protein
MEKWHLECESNTVRNDVKLFGDIIDVACQIANDTDNSDWLYYMECEMICLKIELLKDNLHRQHLPSKIFELSDRFLKNKLALGNE